MAACLGLLIMAYLLMTTEFTAVDIVGEVQDCGPPSKGLWMMTDGCLDGWFLRVGLTTGAVIGAVAGVVITLGSVWALAARESRLTSG